MIRVLHWFASLTKTNDIFPRFNRLRVASNFSKNSITPKLKIKVVRLTLFRLGFFGQSVTGGGSSDPPPSVSLEPIMQGS